MFEGISPASRPDDAALPLQPRVTAKMPEVFQSSGPIAAIRNDLRNMGSRSIQEIDPEVIEDTGLKDRLGNLDDDVRGLRPDVFGGNDVRTDANVVLILDQLEPVDAGNQQDYQSVPQFVLCKPWRLPLLDRPTAQIDRVSINLPKFAYAQRAF